MAAVGGWASLKSEAKTLEAYCEMRLHNSPATSSMPSDVESGDPGAVRLREIEDSLGKLTSVIERLGAAATASASSANAAVAQVSFISFFLLSLSLLSHFIFFAITQYTFLDYSHFPQSLPVRFQFPMSLSLLFSISAKS